MRDDKGRFKPGHSGHPTGRPLGAKNKIHASLKEELETFIREEWPRLKKDFQKMKLEDQWRIIERMHSYFIPRPQEVNMDLDIRHLSDEQLDELFTRVVNYDNSDNKGDKD